MFIAVGTPGAPDLGEPSQEPFSGLAALSYFEVGKGKIRVVEGGWGPGGEECGCRPGVCLCSHIAQGTLPPLHRHRPEPAAEVLDQVTNGVGVTFTVRRGLTALRTAQDTGGTVASSVRFRMKGLKN